MKLTNLSPMLETNDIKDTIEFYTQTLGFTLRGTFEHESTISWALCSGGETMLDMENG